jgi:peptide/nickel transport system permease protein
VRAEKFAFKRKFDVPEKILVKLQGSGRTVVDGKEFCWNGNTDIVLNKAPEQFEITGGDLSKVEFFRYQDNAFNSQFINSLREVVDFKSTFPYISFLNFGKTITTREPINDIIARGVLPSLSVMLPVFVFELVIGIIAALIAAAYKDTLLDRGVLVVSVAGMSISYLVLIIFGQWFLGYYLNWFPVWGWHGVRYLILPVLLGVVSGLGGGVRFYRTIFVNELKSEYLRTAAAKGCSTWNVYAKHLLRNALVPIIARASATLPFIFTGCLLLESFFGIPGLGFAGVEALNTSDIQLLKALVLLSALLFVIMNLLADIAYAWVDPRIKLE